MTSSPIVITGIGAVSPNGFGRETYFDALKRGRSGIRRITQFDPSALSSQVAGEVDFDPGQWFDPKALKHVARVVPMSIAAADEALRDSGLDPSKMDLETREVPDEVRASWDARARGATLRGEWEKRFEEYAGAHPGLA